MKAFTLQPRAPFRGVSVRPVMASQKSSPMTSLPQKFDNEPAEVSFDQEEKESTFTSRGYELIRPVPVRFSNETNVFKPPAIFRNTTSTSLPMRAAYLSESLARTIGLTLTPFSETEASPSFPFLPHSDVCEDSHQSCLTPKHNGACGLNSPPRQRRLAETEDNCLFLSLTKPEPSSRLLLPDDF
jgi:hypothetical protein